MKNKFLMGIVLVLLAVTIDSHAATLLKSSTTQPVDSAFTFVVVSDLHLTEYDGPARFKAFVKQIDGLAEKPKFVLVTGDIHVTPFKKMFAEIKPTIPFHVIAGNHETRNDRDELAKMFPNDFNDKDYYDFTYNDSLFIGICDAAANGDHVGHFESEGIKGLGQGQWLEDELIANSKKVNHIFLFGHIPPSSNGATSGMDLSTNDQRRLRELILKYKPDALFFGHLHTNKEFRIGESPVYILPSLNWNFGKQIAGFYVARVSKTLFKAKFVPLDYSAEEKK
jgi:3',5'-cyclic AMP phosphodiesterase CpdA